MSYRVLLRTPRINADTTSVLAGALHRAPCALHRAAPPAPRPALAPRGRGSVGRWRHLSDLAATILRMNDTNYTLSPPPPPGGPLPSPSRPPPSPGRQRLALSELKVWLHSVRTPLAWFARPPRDGVRVEGTKGIAAPPARCASASQGGTCCPEGCPRVPGRLNVRIHSLEDKNKCKMQWLGSQEGLHTAHSLKYAAWSDAQ